MSLLRCKVVFDQYFSGGQTKHFYLRQISKHPHVQCSALKLVIYKFLQSIVILFQKIKTLC